MKWNVLSLVISLSLTVNIANAVEVYNKDGNKLDIYGKVEVEHYLADSRSGESGDDSYIRFGFQGETKIHDTLTGFGRFEWETTANKPEGENTNKNRLAYVGFNLINFGAVNYGRNYGVVYDTNAWTDVMPLFGGDSMSQTDNFMTGRNRNILTYRNTNTFNYVDNLSFALQYQGKNGDQNISSGHEVYQNNGEGYGFSTAYDLGHGISLGGGYSNSLRTSAQRATIAPGKKAEAWNVGAKFDSNNLYFAAMYGQTLNTTQFGEDNLNLIANKTENIELVAQYLFDSGIQPSIGYVQSKGKHLGFNAGSSNPENNHDLLRYIELGSYYYLNKNISILVDYKINLLKNNVFSREVGLNTDNVVGVGLVYQF